jgi:hypothetical protein
VTSVLILCACGGETSRSEPQRPPSDYGREVPRTADDQVMGADGVSPADKLRQGPKITGAGVEPAAGWGGEEEAHFHEVHPPRQKRDAGR